MKFHKDSLMDPIMHLKKGLIRAVIELLNVGMIYLKNYSPDFYKN